MTGGFSGNWRSYCMVFSTNEDAQPLPFFTLKKLKLNGSKVANPALPASTFQSKLGGVMCVESIFLLDMSSFGRVSHRQNKMASRWPAIVVCL